MAKLLALAVKDLRVLMASKGNLFWVFGFPLLFALLFGAVYAGAGKGPSGMKLAVVDEDKSEFSQLYVTHLESEEALKVTRLDREQALTQVRKGQIAAAVVIRPGFGDGFSGFSDANNPKLQIASDPGQKMQGAYLEGLLAKAQFEVMAKRFRDRKWMRGQMDTWRGQIKRAGGLPGADANVYLRFFDSLDNFLTDVNDRTYKGGLGNGILNVAKLDVQREYDGPRTPFQITFPQAILWAILGCVATFAISIVRERTTGTFQRLRVGPISQVDILAGKGLACFLTCAMVIVLLVMVGKLVFKVPIGSPAMFLLGAVCTCLCFVGLMMLVSTLGKTEQSVVGAGWAVLMVLAMFGGAMMPLAFMPPWMRDISHVSPIK
ncbi:MAG: ABC transporter permease [Phycisphaerae bacterium]|nr:ABC transporter permease [Phycisphaerae bacterium]